MAWANDLSEAEKDMFEVKKFLMEMLPPRTIIDVYYNYIQDNKVLVILSNKEVIDTLKRCPDKIRKMFALNLCCIAYHLKDKNEDYWRVKTF